MIAQCESAEWYVQYEKYWMSQQFYLFSHEPIININYFGNLVIYFQGKSSYLFIYFSSTIKIKFLKDRVRIFTVKIININSKMHVKLSKFYYGF